LCIFFTGQELVPVTIEEPIDCSSESDSESQKAIAVQPDIIASNQKTKRELKKSPNDDLKTEAAPAAIPNETSTSLLVNDYNFILQAMEIPDEEYKTARKFKFTLQTLLAKQFPSCKLIWYRNWYLKLRNTTPLNEMLFYFDTQSKV